MKPAEKRQAVDYARATHGLSKARACGLFQLERSVYYHRPRPSDDASLRAALVAVAAQRRRWGYRRLAVALRREGFTDNHKRIFRVYREERLQVAKRKRRRTARWRGEKPRAPERANERWSLDFVHDATARGQRVRFLNVVDDFTRECLWIETDTSLSGRRVTRVLDELVASRGRPRSLLTDNGPEFIGRALDEWGYREGVSLGFIEPGKPVQNAYVESFNGKFRDECLNEHWFLNVGEARRIVEAWREDYNHERPHSALGYLTPAAYAATLTAPKEEKRQERKAHPAPFLGVHERVRKGDTLSETCPM